MENKRYFQTNSELAHENSTLQQQLSRSSRMNSMLLAQGFEMHTKLSTISIQNGLLREKNGQLKRKIRQIKQQAIELSRAIESIQISPIQSVASQFPESSAAGRCEEMARTLKSKLVLVGKRAKESEMKVGDNLVMIEESEKENYEMDNNQDSMMLEQGIEEHREYHNENMKILEQRNEPSIIPLHNNHQIEMERTRRARKNVSYKLPNLNTKLRQGDPFTDDFGS